MSKRYPPEERTHESLPLFDHIERPMVRTTDPATSEGAAAHLIDDSGDPLYHQWANAMSAILQRTVERATGLQGVQTKRRKPRG